MRSCEFFYYSQKQAAERSGSSQTMRSDAQNTTRKWVRKGGAIRKTVVMSSHRASKTDGIRHYHSYPHTTTIVSAQFHPETSNS